MQWDGPRPRVFGDIKLHMWYEATEKALSGWFLVVYVVPLNGIISWKNDSYGMPNPMKPLLKCLYNRPKWLGTVWDYSLSGK